MSLDPLRVWEDAIFPGEAPQGLYHLAVHILSICANSASCERLFSTLGLILTKLRTRLSNKRLLGLAKLKMHARDTILWTTEAKAEVRKYISTQIGRENPANQATRDPNSQIPISTELNPALPYAAPTSGRNSTDSITTLTDEMIRNLAADDDENEAYNYTPDLNMGFPVTLKDLFDFSSLAWSLDKRYNAIRSLDEELEFYQLLELDAVGDEDIDHELESIVGSVIFEG